MLDDVIGANVLIRDVQIRSGGAQNVLLEEIQNVNILTSLKYDYHTNDNIKQKRALTEGCQQAIPDNRSTLGAEITGAVNLNDNPYWKQTTTDWTNDDFDTVKALIKIPGGIFDSSKVFPLGLTEGLRVTILLEQTNRVFRQLHSVVRDRSAQQNPRFHSTDGVWAAPSTWTNAQAEDTFFVDFRNNMRSTEQFPFCVGEKISFYNPFNGSDIGTNTDVEMIISALDWVQTANNPGTGGGGLIQVTLAAAATLSIATDVITTSYVLYSRSVLDATSFAPTLSIDNVELLVQQVEMPEGYTSKMKSMLKSGGAMNYDFTSFTNYKYSQLQSDRVVNIRLPIQASRCKAILAIPTDASVYSTKDAVSASGTYKFNSAFSDCDKEGVNNSTRSGLVGIADNATEYQFVYDGKLNPSRKVPVDRISMIANNNRSINQQWLIECEKALYMSGMDGLSFRAYQENFFIGRALSLQNGIYDARGKDFNLQVEYTSTDGPTKNKLWNCFVAHIRRIVVRGEQISMEI